jgi:alkylation response protein AidB-like acyl-CoA dehydrogenase
MNLELSDEQVMLRDAAAAVLARRDGVAAARAARDGSPPPDLWPVAREAGWPGMLVPEAWGGAGLQLFDAMLVLQQCGRRLEGAGLVGHLCATVLLGRAAQRGDATAAALLPELATGARRAALVPARPPADGEGWTVEANGSGARRVPAPRLETGDGDARLTGVAGYQPDAAGADVLVIAAVVAGGAAHAVLVDAGAGGLVVEPQVRGDASRPLGAVRLESTSGTVLDVDGDDPGDAWYAAQALLAADALGVCEATLEMGVAYAKERHAFGRPIGSYQAIKHQLVEVLRHTERARNLCHYAGYAAERARDELPLAASCARLAAEDGADLATRTCIAVHGGIGATWEHAAPYYWWRAQLSRLLLGGAAGAADRIAIEMIARARARRGPG